MLLQRAGPLLPAFGQPVGRHDAHGLEHGALHGKVAKQLLFKRRIEYQTLYYNVNGIATNYLVVDEEGRFRGYEVRRRQIKVIQRCNRR